LSTLEPARGGFAALSVADLDFFRGVCEVVTDADDLVRYNVDWMGKFSGCASVCVKPCNTEQVSELLKYCNERRLAVVPQGGNTGLVGGSVPLFDEIVLSTEKMDSVLGFDEMQGIVSCESGVILQDLDSWLGDQHGTWIAPLDLGARGTCQLGGNISTAAGGVRFVRYGSLRGNVTGIEAVQADGTVLDLMSDMKKDNTGYDLKQVHSYNNNNSNNSAEPTPWI
jgi:D-2-hydroxyglutarate dehydrogenase